MTNFFTYYGKTDTFYEEYIQYIYIYKSCILTCSYLLMLTIPGWLRAVTLQSSSAKVVHLVF